MRQTQRNPEGPRHLHRIPRLSEAPWEAHGDLTSLAPHERLPEILVVPREKIPTGAASQAPHETLPELPVEN